ncbi:hypothetical protein GCM10010174_88330 [Kutzneria viridogrisea]|uniref:Uncharacterized protein n=1 Tax=Kutzneria viridogrisea TaxID=47990 RepID=A0ABR6BZX4_9PSEU|nr:hypothetical protein [Kutzneria viridogrisea]
MTEHHRQREGWLLDWREEIAAVHAYATVPVHPHDVVRIAAEHVVPRLGAALTAQAREARRLQLDAREMAEDCARRGLDDHRDLHLTSNLAWGARTLLTVGLGVHLGLDHQHATWLAEALSGFDLPRRPA